MRVPHRVDSQVQAEGPVRGDEEGDRRDTQDAGREDGRRGDSRGQHVRGPHTHMPAGAAEVRAEQRGREAEGKELDNPARAAPRVEEADGQGPHAVGTRLLREHHRPGRGQGEGVRQEAGGGKQDRVAARPLGPGR